MEVNGTVRFTNFSGKLQNSWARLVLLAEAKYTQSKKSPEETEAFPAHWYFRATDIRKPQLIGAAILSPEVGLLQMWHGRDPIQSLQCPFLWCFAR